MTPLLACTSGGHGVLSGSLPLLVAASVAVFGVVAALDHVRRRGGGL